MNMPMDSDVKNRINFKGNCVAGVTTNNYMYMHMRTHVHVHVQAHAYVHAYVHVSVHVNVHAYLNV